MHQHLPISEKQMFEIYAYRHHIYVYLKQAVMMNTKNPSVILYRCV